jgi:hypothetical protein
MATTSTPNSFTSDVLHAENPSKLSQAEVDKAIARHQREHPAGRIVNPASKPKKATPRH